MKPVDLRWCDEGFIFRASKHPPGNFWQTTSAPQQYHSSCLLFSCFWLFFFLFSQAGGQCVFIPLLSPWPHYPSSPPRPPPPPFPAWLSTALEACALPNGRRRYAHTLWDRSLSPGRLSVSSCVALPLHRYNDTDAPPLFLPLSLCILGHVGARLILPEMWEVWFKGQQKF